LNWCFAILCTVCFLSFCFADEPKKDEPKANEVEDVVILKDGTVIKGKVVDPGGPAVRIEKKYGSISVMKIDVKEYRLAGKELPGAGTQEDIVYLNSGEKFSGKARLEDKGKTVAVEVKSGETTATVTFPRSDVLKIDWAFERKGAVGAVSEDPLTARLRSLVTDLGSADSEKKASAVTQLEKIGIFAIDYLREVRESQSESAKALIDRVLLTNDLKTLISARAASEVPNIYERLSSQSAQEKLKCLGELILAEAEDLANLLAFLAGRTEEQPEVWNFCLYNLAKMEKNEALVKLLSAEDGRIRFLAAVYLADNGIPAGVSYLIDGLESAQTNIRQTAIEKLTKLATNSFGFSADAPLDARKAAVMRWRQWWKENEANLLNQSLKSIKKKQISEGERDFSRIYQKKAVEAWDAGKLDEASRNFKQSLEIDPSNIRARINYAEFLFSATGDAKSAQTQLETVLKRYPEEGAPIARAQAYYHLGLIDLSLGNYRDAIHNFQAAISIDRTCTDAYIGLGRAYFDKALFDPELSESHAEEASKSEKERLQLRLATIENSLQAYWAAVTLLDREILPWQDPNYKKLRRQNEREVVTREYERRGKDQSDLVRQPQAPQTEGQGVTTPEEEEKYIKELQQTKGQILWLIANTYGIIPDWKKCVSTLEETVKIDQKNIRYLCRLALALALAGEKEKVKQTYEKCLTIDPNCEAAKQGLEDLK
jgi:tetratricopeptide (TPR) repeat protein